MQASRCSPPIAFSAALKLSLEIAPIVEAEGQDGGNLIAQIHPQQCRQAEEEPEELDQHRRAAKDFHVSACYPGNDRVAELPWPD